MPNLTSPLVIKVGGSTLDAQDTSLADVITIHRKGRPLVLVHGGGDTVTQWMGKLGVQAQFTDGLRVTDAESLEVVTAVLAGLVNKQLVATLLSLGGQAIGLSGVDGGMLRATIEDPNLGFVGGGLQVDPQPLQVLLQAGFIPVVAPISVHHPEGTDLGFHLLNVNADTVAGALAVGLGASHLIFMTDVAGILDGDGSTQAHVSYQQAPELVASGVVRSGMVPKLKACAHAAAHGTRSQIVNGKHAGALLACIRGDAVGTTVL